MSGPAANFHKEAGTMGDRLVVSALAGAWHFARWKALLRRPLGERLRKEAMYTTGEQAPHPLIELCAPAWSAIASQEVRGLLLREQLVAALDYLERGEAALADHLDVLTGKPFRFEKTADGFRLLADVPGLEKGATLVIGESSP
jgi:hypothetical protein